MELFHLPVLAHLARSALPNHLRRPPSPTHSVAACAVARLSPRLRYFAAVRLLTQRRSPFRSRL